MPDNQTNTAESTAIQPETKTEATDTATTTAVETAQVSDIKKIGDTEAWELACEVVSESQGFVKATKVMNILGGCLVNVSTKQKNPDGNYSVAESLVFVPNNHFRNGKIGPM